jgi:hypothetical protein
LVSQIFQYSTVNFKAMSRDIQLKERWESVVNYYQINFQKEKILDLDAIIYLIGVQELG